MTPIRDVTKLSSPLEASVDDVFFTDAAFTDAALPPWRNMLDVGVERVDVQPLVHICGRKAAA